jgi:hypothetical protein
MRKVAHLSRIGVVATSLLALSGAEAADRKLAFLTCPIVRDTPTVPCWLAEFRGETYYLGIQTDVSADFSPPSLGHKVLVEGEPTSEPRICGGIPIKNVNVSVIQEKADNCQALLPVDGDYVLPFESPRPPGPSKGRLAFNYPQPEKPQPPFKPKTFTITYDFDLTVGFRHPRFLAQVLEYAQQTNARTISITGYRGATALTDGGRLVERDGLGRKRAEEVAGLLKSAGLTQPTYKVAWKDGAVTGDAGQRRVTVDVVP